MTITCSLAVTSVGPVMANSAVNGILTVTNNGADTVTVTDIRLSEASNMGIRISQPQFLTPNVAPGSGQPTIATTATSYFPFSFVSPSPNTPGDSPNAPNGYIEGVFPPVNTVARLQCVVTTNDGTNNIVGTASLNVAIGTPVAPLPKPLGGVLQYNGASNAVNWFFF